jgi:hypothetical protein
LGLLVCSLLIYSLIPLSHPAPNAHTAALQHGDPPESTVTRIATDHRFWELGRFSVTYRALFGESPSEALRHPAEETAIDLDHLSVLSSDGIFGAVALAALATARKFWKPQRSQANDIMILTDIA